MKLLRKTQIGAFKIQEFYFKGARPVYVNDKRVQYDYNRAMELALSTTYPFGRAL